MEVEIVRWNKNNMDNILTKSFSDITSAHNFYSNWKCKEDCDDNNYFIGGKDWNNNIKETLEIPINYNYTYTYSVNLWDTCNNEMQHSHNFVIYSTI